MLITTYKNLINILQFFLIIFLIPNCTSPTEIKEQDTLKYSYTIEIQKMNMDSLHVVLEISLSGSRDSIHLLAPPLFSDNPFLEQTGKNFINFTLTDPDGNSIRFVEDSVILASHKHLSISFYSEESLVRAEYDVRFDYFDTLGRPVPFIGEKYGYIRGSYIFAVPYKDLDIVDIWRSEYDFSVTYNINENIDFFGDPLPEASFHNSYELLYSTSALNADVISEGKSGGQEFRFLALSDTIADKELFEKGKDDFKIILKDVTGMFGTLNGDPLYVLFGINKVGGLEGMYAFSIIDPFEDDEKGWFNVIIAHELIHCWIGVRVGDYEDPWWKEGTTSYLGYLIALRNNLGTGYFIRRYLCLDLSKDKWVKEMALSDPDVIERLFAFDDNCVELVYYKGAQVNMLMDRKIREDSNRNSSLPEVLSKFVKEFYHKAFHRDEYLSFIKTHSGVDVSGIFKKYVDKSGAIPKSVLKENSNALIKMGAFGDVDTLKYTESYDRTEIRDWNFRF